MEKMLKTDFEVKYSTENKEWFVVKVCDELTKNYHDLENLVTGIMPENKTDPLCPVASFRKYISHLHPHNKYMWQYPLNKLDPQKPNIWFSRKNIGKKPLAAFMSDVSKKMSSPRSTQIIQFMLLDAQCLLVVTFQVLKSCPSVATRASNPWLFIRKQDREKIQMGEALFQAMTRN